LCFDYVGQTGRSIEIRHREQVRYIKTNNTLSAYALPLSIIDANIVILNMPCSYYEHAEKES
jgi:hypothetical protein